MITKIKKVSNCTFTSILENGKTVWELELRNNPTLYFFIKIIKKKNINYKCQEVCLIH